MKPYKCPVCEGRGVVPPNFYSGLGYVGDTTNITCQACQGKGIVWDGSVMGGVVVAHRKRPGLVIGEDEEPKP